MNDSKTRLIRTTGIFAEEYNHNLSLDEVEKIGTNLVSFFSLILENKNKNQNEKPQSSSWQTATN